MPTIGRGGNGHGHVRQHEMGERGEAAPERRAKIERGRKNAARGAAAEADRGRQQLQAEQQRHQADRGHAAAEDRLDDAVANAVDVGMAEDARQCDHAEAERRHADDVLNVRTAGQLGKPSSITTSRRMKAHDATPHSKPISAKPIASGSCSAWAKVN